MDRWRRWRPRRPTGRAGARRVRVTALAVFGVAAGLAVLLAFLFHLGVAAVVVAILGTVPALYLAWLAVPGVISPPEPGAVEKPAYGHLAGQWDPVDLGVHQVIGGGPMPPYVRRPHDELLRAVLDPAVPASRLVVVRGGSSTGKTRAAYEAVAGQLADWQLDYPLNAAALAARLDAGIPARTVLWLGELRQYADDDGGAAVLGRLADLLQGEGHLVITTVWREQWAAYTAAARAGPGRRRPGRGGRAAARAAARAHRHRPPPGSIRPAAGLSTSRPSSPAMTWTPRPATGDPVLAAAAAAAAAAGQDGQVAQYLAGVPDLLDRYAGDDGDPYGQAVITAAMDATRLGHASPLPAALLQEAAVGYLTGPQRTKPIATWRDTALDWAAAELRGAVRALQPVPPPAGTGVAGYQVADYLDQHGRRTRQDQLGPASLWDALTAARRHRQRPGPSRAGRARPRPVPPRRRPMDNSSNPGQHRRRQPAHHPPAPGQPRRRHPRRPTGPPPRSASTTRGPSPGCCGRWARPGPGTRSPPWPPGPPPTPASTTRGPSPGCWGRCARPGPATRSPPWLARAAAHASLDNPGRVAVLLGALGEAGASDAVTALAGPGRRPRQPRRPGGRRRAAGGAGRGRGQRRGHRPAARAAAHASLDDPGAVAALLRALGEAGASDAVTALAGPGRRPRQPRRPGGRRRPAGGAARGRGQRRGHRTLAARAAADGQPRQPGGVAVLLGALRAVGAGDAVTVPWPPGPPPTPASTTRGASPSCWGRCARPGTRTRPRPGRPGRRPRQPRRPGAVAGLLGALREAGAGDAVTTLAARAAAHASLDDPGAVAGLLGALREAGAGGRGHRPGRPGPPPRPASTTRGRRRPAGGAARGRGHRRGHRPAGPRPRHPRQPRRPVGCRRAAGGAARGRGHRRGHRPAGPRPRRPRQPRRPGGVAVLLGALREAGARDGVTTLAARAAAQASLDDPGAVARLLGALREAGDTDAVTALLARDPATHASLHDPGAIASCWVRCARPGTPTGPRPWPPGPPPRVCSIASSPGSALMRPSADTRLGASRAEPHRKPGIG